MPEISLAKARLIIRKSFEKAREMGLSPIAVVVLDSGGHPKAFEREDGASPGRYAVAQGKAYGSVMMGVPGSKQAKMAEDRAYFTNAVNGAFDGQFVPVQGGVLVRDKRGAIVGAVGVSGDISANDAAAAMAGIEAAGFTGEA